MFFLLSFEMTKEQELVIAQGFPVVMIREDN